MYSGTSWPTNLFIQGDLHLFISDLTISPLQKDALATGSCVIPPVIGVVPLIRGKQGKGRDFLFFLFFYFEIEKQCGS